MIGKLKKEKLKKENTHSRNIFIAFILNLAFSLVEFIGGIVTNSISIISDSIHDFGDAISIAVSWILEKKSERKPDEKYTFGYGRYSILGAFITSTVLLIGSVIMIFNAIHRLIYPEIVNYNGMLMFAILGLIANGIGAYVTSRGEKLNEKVVSLHLLEDLLGWIAVLITSIVMKIFNIPLLDPILSLYITIYILWNVIKNYKSIFVIFLQKKPDNIDVTKLIQEIEKKAFALIGIHHIHVWSLDGVNNCMSLHAEIDACATKQDIINIKNIIKNEAKHHNISHVTIEIEFMDEFCNELVCHIHENNSSKTRHHHHHHHH